MYKTIKISFALTFIAGAALIALLAYQALTPSVAMAQQEEVGAQVGQPEQTDYTYTTQPGDTYTQLARKAIQTYGVDNQVNLSPEGIVFAETNLTQEADASELTVGQEVTISGDMVKKWVDEAAKLSEAQQNAWSVYLPFVDFNTDSVGESN